MAFRDDVRRFDRLVDARLRRLVIGVGAELTRELGRATPFDTGRAAASWTAAVNGPDTRTQPPEFVAGSREAAVQFQRIDLSGFVLGDSIHISNSVEYIPFLNAGSSRQAPSNFVELTFQATVPRIAARVARSL